MGEKLARSAGELARALGTDKRQIFRWKKEASFPKSSQAGYDVAACEEWCHRMGRRLSKAARPVARPVATSSKVEVADEQAALDREDQKIRDEVSAAVASEDKKADQLVSPGVAKAGEVSVEEKRYWETELLKAKTAEAKRHVWPTPDARAAIGSTLFQLRITLTKVSDRLAQLVHGKSIADNREIIRRELLDALKVSAVAIKQAIPKPITDEELEAAGEEDIE